MKVVAIAVVSGALAVVGANELLPARASDSRSSPGTAAAAKSATNRKCWSPDKIQNERFSVRGLPGSIRSFDVNAIEGCVFNVKIELDSPTGARSLDYNATYAAGDRPIFVRYNTAP